MITYETCTADYQEFFHLIHGAFFQLKDALNNLCLTYGPCIAKNLHV